MCFYLITGWCVLASLSAQSDDVFANAEWLRDPAFQDTSIINTYHREKTDDPKFRGPQNIHTLFRKEITLRAKPASAVLYITGDDYYKFYVNGAFVVQGPEPGYPEAYPYYFLDITEFLEPGPNCLASHGYYQGLCNRVWVSADNRAGFMLSLEVTYPDNATEHFATDASWKCFQLQAFPASDTIGYKTQFAENIDMRLMPLGWQSNGFNDSAWIAPLTGKQDHVFVKQITPPLQHTVAKPDTSKDMGNGRYVYDFGREIVGHTRIRIQGPAGHILTVRHAEELSGPDQPCYELRANCKYEEKPILSGDNDLIEFYDYRAFRYMEILDAPSPPEVWVDMRRHPFDPAKCSFTSSNELLQNIWTICRNGVEMNAQGVFVDCPTREKGQYLGDTLIESRAHLWLTADPSLTRKALRDFQRSQYIHPGLMAVAPSSFMQEIAEYSLQWPLLLDNYYRHTGDRALTEALVDAVFKGLFDYFAGFENKDGLISNMTEKWVVVDWPKNLRDDYDYDYAADKANTVLNAFYYGSLHTAAGLLRELGRDASDYDAKAERIAKAFAASLVDQKTGLYVDAPGSAHSSLHANAVPLFFGLTEGANRDAMLNLIREKRLNCGVYVASFVIEACFKNGANDLAYDLLTSTDQHSWSEMIRNGATACMEAWGPDQKWNTSWCHAWSSSPIYLITEYVMGLRPAEPGWRKIAVAPAKIASLPDITLTVPIPGGKISALYTAGVGYTITAPSSVPVEVQAPEGMQIMIKQSRSHAAPVLTPADLQHLAEKGWMQRVGANRGVWVSMDQQMFYIIEKLRPVWQAPCSTAAAGAGAEANSNKTPLGWHRIAQKIGANAPWGQIFRSRKGNHELWKPGDTVTEDLVLTRLLVLDGEEPGINQGKNDAGISVDSNERCIYIHGTNAEERIGAPVSHGCIRLLNDDVIEAFDLIAEGAPVLITERASNG